VDTEGKGVSLVSNQFLEIWGGLQTSDWLPGWNKNRGNLGWFCASLVAIFSGCRHSYQRTLLLIFYSGEVANLVDKKLPELFVTQRFF